MAGALVDDAQLRVVIGLSAPRDTKASLAPGVFAAAFAQALTARLGQADWWRGDSVQQRAFAGAALRLREEQLETLQGQVAGVLGELRDKPDSYYRSALDQARVGQSAALSSARGWVEAAFAGRESASYTLDAELGLIRKLAKAQPSFLVLRPRP
jgi:hypothetical protein